MTVWEDKRKEARQLENKIEANLASLNKIITGLPTHKVNQNIELASNDNAFIAVAHEVRDGLAELTEVCDFLGNIDSVGGSEERSQRRRCVTRLRDVLQDLTQEFLKIHHNYEVRKENECHILTVNNRQKLDNDLLMTEYKHVMICNRLVDEQLSIAIGTQGHLVSQRLNLKGLQTRFHDLTSHFPAINSLVKRIHFHRRKDSLVIGIIVGICTFILLLYSLH